jgi:hypothetical protein
MACLKFRGPAIGLTLLAATLSHGSAGSALAEQRSDLSQRKPPQSQPSPPYAVGDQVPTSVKLDDDGFPDRPYGVLIVDQSVVVVIDRMTRRVVEVH